MVYKNGAHQSIIKKEARLLSEIILIILRATIYFKVCQDIDSVFNL